MSEQRGVYKAPFEVDPPEKISQSLMARIDVCPYSGLLYIEHKGGPQTARQAGGEAMHEAIERTIKLAIEEGDGDVPPEVAKDVAQAVMDERTDLALPAEEQENVRLALWNWARGTILNIESIVAVEAMMEVEIGGWLFRGKPDLVQIVNGEAFVDDWKSSMAIPTVEAYERSFQAQSYGLLALEGCMEGETVPIGRGLSGVHTREVYPRYRPDESSGLVHRYAYFDRAQLHDFKRTLESHIAKLEHGLESGKWVASPGSHCATCPASSACPIPANLREVKTIGTDGEAKELAERILFLEPELAEAKKTLKGWCDENGPVQVGDYEWTFTFTETERMIDREAVKEALRAAGLDPESYFKKAPSTRFGKQRVARG